MRLEKAKNGFKKKKLPRINLLPLDGRLQQEERWLPSFVLLPYLSNSARREGFSRIGGEKQEIALKGRHRSSDVCQVSDVKKIKNKTLHLFSVQ